MTPALSGPQADGTFAFTGVTPGRYVLVARTGPGAMMSFPAGGGGTTNNPDVPSLFAMQELSVDGTAIVDQCLKRRLLINCTHGTVLRLLPALNLTAEQLHAGCDILEDVLLSYKV